MFKRFKDDSGSSHKEKTSIGKSAERYAQNFLKSKKLCIIKTNHLTPRGELDIIALDGECIVFVEVRMRSNSRFGTAAESINHKKQKSLIYAATHYLQSTHQWDKVNCRFDAICLTSERSKSGKENQYQVEWIRNAFNIH